MSMSKTQDEVKKTKVKKFVNKPPCCDEAHSSEHPDHSYALNRLHRAQGQLSGVESMITDRRYCPEILIQMRAAIAALRNIELQIFQTHLKSCVADAMNSKNRKVAETKIHELTDLLMRRTTI